MQNSELREQVIEKFRDGHRINLRPSSVQQFLRCPYQWATVHLLGRKKSPAAAATAGTALHSAFEEGYTYKRDTKKMPPVDLLKTAAQEEWKKLNNEEEIIYRKGEDIQKYEDDILDGVAAYHQEIMPAVEPLLIEERFTVSLDHKIIQAFTGTADLIASGGLLNSSQMLIDYKFTKRATSASHYMLQQNAYLWLAKEGGGKELDVSYLHNIVRPTKTRGATINIIEVDYKEKYLKYIVNKILDSITEFIEDGTGLLNGFSDPVSNYLCSPEWCAFWDECPHIAGLRHN